MWPGRTTVVDYALEELAAGVITMSVGVNMTSYPSLRGAHVTDQRSCVDSRIWTHSRMICGCGVLDSALHSGLSSRRMNDGLKDVLHGDWLTSDCMRYNQERTNAI